MEKFSYEEGGYNRKEVNDFINEVIVQTEDIVKRCKDQKAELESLRKEINHYKNLESSLKEAIVRAEGESNNIKRMAQREAEMIIRDAKNNANRIVNEALLSAERTEIKKETLEKNMKIFKRKLKLIMDQQMAVIDEIEVLELE